MLKLKNIKKSYLIGEHSQEVLTNININFRRSEFVSILGSSGSGKTTLLNIIGGLDKYDSGELIIEGVSTKDYSNRDWDSYRNYRVGFIFQNYNLIMHQNVLSNVEISLTLSGISKDERRKRAIEALIKVGLEDHIYKKPNQLSGGQMQRVAIARALVNNPEIILADEPTGALDSKTSVQIMELLKEIAKEKLVIMVTHNSELAYSYSTRIVELKDGIIIADSNSYDFDEIKTVKEIKPTSLSVSRAFLLSFNNLLTKKGRTFLIAFAGSIGIIGIALILSLSNGVNNYTHNLEREALIDYPITIARVNYDLFGSLSSAFSSDDSNSIECLDDIICSQDDIIKESVFSNEKGLLQRNNLGEFKKYIENSSIFKNNGQVSYDYDIDLHVYTNDYHKVDVSEFGNDNNIFNKLSIDETKYQLLAGNMPQKYNEIVLVVPENNVIDDSLLYALGLKNREEIAENLKKIKTDEKYRVKHSEYSFNAFLDKTYKLILNTDYYKEENGFFIDYSNDKIYMKKKIDNGVDLKIVGILKDSNTLNSYIGYTNELILYLIEQISKTSIYQKQIVNKDINVLTNAPFDGLNNNYESLIANLGIYELDEPSRINIYPKSYESKQIIIGLIKKYNETQEKNGRSDLIIAYTDLMKSLINSVTKIVDVISYVLIGFVAISLIVSSIMIAIITYISVLERAKEIGILRAIGASKKDIIRVFISETIIEGATAGFLGIFLTLVISLPINLIVSAIFGINGIATLPFTSAIFLLMLSVILNVIAGIIPAQFASKKNPVEALRME